MTAGPPPASPTSPHPNERGAAWVLCGAVGCGTLLRCLGRWHWLFELTTHFAVQAAMLAALAALVLAIRRHGRLAAVTLGLALLNVIDLWPLYRPVDSIPVGLTTPLTVVTSNVLSSNHHGDTLRDWLDKEQADVVFLCEPDDWWGFEVARWSQRWPHQYVKTRADNFGVGILSRYPLIEPQVISLAHNNPALLCQIEAHGTRWTILGLHPLPPKGRRRAVSRNAQLQDAARLIGTLRGPLIVAGDFNVTSSSPYFQDLLQATGLIDTRLGRGLQPSWPANNPFLRIPIDHVLISPEVQLHDRRLGPAIGSDHLPLIVRVSVAPAARSPSE